MRNTFNISFYCRSSKTNKKGLSPIEISIIINGKRCFIQLPRKEYPDVFKKSVESKRGNEIKEYLDEVRNQLYRIETDMMKSGIALSSDTLKEYFRSGGIKDYTLGDLFKEYQDLLWKRVLANDLSIKAYDKYRNAFDCFFKHVNRGTLVEHLTPSIVQNFLAECNRTYQASTTNGIMTKIKTVVLYAKDNGKININPFINIKCPKPKLDIEYLTEEEVECIKNKPISIERLEKIRDVAVFQICSGLSYSDLCNLKKDDIKFSEDGTAFIYKKRMKTGTPYTSVIFPDGVKILEKYNYNLPVITNQRTNIYLKELQTICGINKNFHTHLFRKTYGTMLLNRGVRIEVVSKALGHSSVRISERYYCQMLKDTVVDEIKSVF